MPRTSQPQTTHRPPSTRPVEPAIGDGKLLDELDALLDEIDEALESNALEVTRTYIQRSGE